jgi:hypothetical protein
VKPPVQWEFKSLDRGAGTDPDQYGGPWMPRAKSWAMGFALIALNSVSSVQSVGSCAKPLCYHLNLSGDTFPTTNVSPKDHHSAKEL